MDISRYKGRIIDKFGARYLKISGNNIDKFLNDNINEITNLFKKLYYEKDLYLNDFNKKNEKTKTRWIKSELERDNSSFFKELNTAKELYRTTQNNIFFNIYGCSSPLELEKMNKEKLFKWKENKEAFLEFPYIKGKHLSAIKPALCNDVVIYLLNIYEELDKSVIKVPCLLQEIPEDTTNRIKLLKGKEEDIDSEDINKQLYYDKSTGEKLTLVVKRDEYVASFFEGAVTELDIEIRNEILKQLKVFNSLDREILQYILQQTKELYSADKIERDLVDIVNAIGRKNTESNRENVKNSLYKLGSSGYSKNGKFVGRFFSLQMLKVKANNGYKDVVSIYIDGMLREIVLSNNTFNFYADKFNLLSKDAQKILITLQNERIIKVLNNDTSLFTIKTFSDFRKAIYFNNKRTIKKRVLLALDELIKHRMGIKNYEIINEYEFRIEFFKFAQRDINLITGKDFKYGDFIDGSYEIIR